MGAEIVRKAKFEDAIELTGYGFFNILILLACGGTLMVVIVETMAMMFIAPASQCDLELTLSTKGLLNAISFLGVVLSSHLWGFIADTRGRRNVLIISMIASFITSILSSISPMGWLFILIRFINGFFVGGASAVVYAYAGEFHDKVYRPKVVAWIATFVAFGNMYIPGLAWLILPLDFHYYIPYLEIDFRPWRLLVICYGMPSLLFALCLMFLPESPKYLLAQGQSEEALQILRKMYAMNSMNDPEYFPVDQLVYDEEANVKDSKKIGILKSMWMQTVPLLQTPYLLKTFMVSLLQFGAFCFSSGLLMWYPELLNLMNMFGKENPDKAIYLCSAVHYYNDKQYLRPVNATLETFIPEDLALCDDTVDTEVFLTSLIVGSTFAVLYILIGVVINIIGGKNLLIGFLTITTICGIAAQNMSGQSTLEGLIGVFLTEATCVGIINTIAVELFPTQLRAMALAISLMAGRFGAVAGSNATGPLIYGYCDYLFYIFAAVHMVLIITTILLPSTPSEKKAKEIEAKAI